MKVRFNDSPVWKDLLKIRHIYLRGRKVKPNSGEKTLFWTDPWSDDGPLCMKYSVLFELCNDKNVTIQKFRDNGGLLSFGRWLPTVLSDQWKEVRCKVLNKHHNEDSDKISWKWTKTGLFCVKTTYDHLTSDDYGDAYTRLWKAKIPYKIKIFLWLLEKGATLTKDNMVKRNWNGDPTYRFCCAVETIDHLFFQCPTTRVVWGIIAHCIGASNIPINLHQFWNWITICLPNVKHIHTFGLAAICWATWKDRNKACFEKKIIKHPAEIVCQACSFMMFWSGLYIPDFQTQLAEGVKVLLSSACRILASQQRTSTAPPRLLPAPNEDGEEEEDN